jgi:hypothetical protein
MTTYTEIQPVTDETVAAFLQQAEWGFILPPAVDVNGDPMEVPEAEIANEDYWSPEDLDAWADYMDDEREDPRIGMTIFDLWTERELEEMADRLADREWDARDF